MQYTVLASAYAYLATILGNITTSYADGFLPVAVTVLTAAGTLYFLLLGLMVIRGVIASPLAEIGMSALKFGLVVALLSSTGFTSTVIATANNLPGALISAGGGTPVSNPGEAMDKYFWNAEKLVSVVQNKWAKDQADMIGSSTAAGIVGSIFGEKAGSTTAAVMSPSQSAGLFVDRVVDSIFLAITLMFAGASAAVGFVIYVFALFSLDVVLALTPIAIACTLFAQTRWIFQGWLSQLLNFIFLMVIIAIITGIVLGLNSSVMSDLTGISTTTGSAGQMLAATSGGTSVAFASTAEVIMACAAVVIIYILGTLFFYFAPSIASGIFGGVAAGGHNFLAVGANQILSRLARPGMPAMPRATTDRGGSIKRGNG